MFSKACEYGIRSTIYVARQSLEDKRASQKDISREIDSPVAFTAKILQQLVRNNILSSVMGPTGGFHIEKSDWIK
ncbi:MAG: Rrf2 family transcriptional regulator [Cyclobacteriaceae bacterium]